MASKIPSQQELYDIFKVAAQNVRPDLTDFSEGSVLDTLAGVFSLGGQEVGRLIVDEFNKTFFDTAGGPEVTGGADNLQTLAVDHFGTKFSRPAAAKAGGIVTFSRPTSGFGNVTIPIGTIVKTPPNANGEAQRFETIAAVTITGLTINASVRALIAGAAGNVESATVTIIESSLLDSSITVSNALAFAGGAAEQSDSEYLATIRNLIETLRGATLDAIEATAKTVSGVVTATAIETLIPVIEWDVGLEAPKVGELFFRIPKASLYIADANGTASSLLISDVTTAIDPVRACGVEIQIFGATPLVLNWSASFTLNPSGPNYAILSSDPQLVLDSMSEYLSKLPIGTGFSRVLANNAIFTQWGPSGTGDLTSFQTVTPVGDVAASAVTKIVPGTLGIV